MRVHLHASIIVCAGLVSGCGGAPDVVLRGSVTHRERLALPPNAVVHVQVADVSVADVAAPVLAETTIVTAGRQVPIPFELRIRAGAIDPQRTYNVRATVKNGDQLLFTTDTGTPVLTRGNPTQADLVLVRASGGAPTAGPVQYRAPVSLPGRLVGAPGGGLRFIACGAEGEGIPITDLPSGEAAKMLAELGSGPRGVVALVRLKGEQLEEIRYAAFEGPPCEKLLPGGDVEARGNEPFWSLRIDAGESWFRTPEKPDGAPLPGGRWSEQPGGAWRYEVQEPTGGATPILVLELTPERCVDSMSGARYPYRAVLTQGDQRFVGCALERRSAPGRDASAPAPGDAAQPAATPLAGTKWRLVDASGTPALADPAATLEFFEAGKVSGSGGCNRFSGTAKTTGTTLAFGPLATTRMACVGPVGEQEGHYFAALQSATRYTLEGASLRVYHGKSAAPLRFERM